jgi:hypothetical protein
MPEPRTHQRHQIKERFKQILTQVKAPASGPNPIQYFTDAGLSVYNSRFFNVKEEEFPVILIYSPSETTEETSDSEMKRTLTIMVECLAQDDDGEKLSLVLSRIASQVESKMFNHDTLSTIPANSSADDALVSGIYLKSTEEAYDPEGDSSLAAVRLEWSVEYITEPVAEGPDSDFETGHINYDNLAEDLVSVPIV